MIKYFCDICGKEKESKRYYPMTFTFKTPKTVEAQNHGVTLAKFNMGYDFTTKELDLCENCRDKIEEKLFEIMVK